MPSCWQIARAVFFLISWCLRTDTTRFASVLRELIDEQRTRDKAALRQSVLQPGERKSVWELVKAAHQSNSKSRTAMMPDLWAAREPEAGRATGMER